MSAYVAIIAATATVIAIRRNCSAYCAVDMPRCPLLKVTSGDDGRSCVTDVHSPQLSRLVEVIHTRMPSPCLFG